MFKNAFPHVAALNIGAQPPVAVKDYKGLAGETVSSRKGLLQNIYFLRPAIDLGLPHVRIRKLIENDIVSVASRRPRFDLHFFPNTLKIHLPSPIRDYKPSERQFLTLRILQSFVVREIVKCLTRSLG